MKFTDRKFAYFGTTDSYLFWLPCVTNDAVILQLTHPTGSKGPWIQSMYVQEENGKRN